MAGRLGWPEDIARGKLKLKLSRVEFAIAIANMKKLPVPDAVLKHRDTLKAQLDAVSESVEPRTCVLAVSC